MSSAILSLGRQSLLRHSTRDVWLMALALVHGAILLCLPSPILIALGLWWNCNTIAHSFIHKPFFRLRSFNALFAAYLTLLLGIPQSLWRDRHMAHHAGLCWRFRLSPRLICELILVLSLWGVLLARSPAFFLTLYLPAYAAGLGLCALQGYYEHAQGTTSYHGTLYNRLFFNDGYHVEHHAEPALHWTQLPECSVEEIHKSRWPPVLRWLETPLLEILEQAVLRSLRLQRFMLACHLRAFQAFLPRLSSVGRVGIVGGGLFPRTVLILRKLLPAARLVVIDASRRNLQVARPFLGDSVELVHQLYSPERLEGFDLIVIPLSFMGDRDAIYRHPPARFVLVHDWIWQRRGSGKIVSLILLKRLNLVQR